MPKQIYSIAHSAVQLILRSFEEACRVNQIIASLPVVNNDRCVTILMEAAYVGSLSTPHFTQEYPEQVDPPQIATEVNANYLVQLEAQSGQPRIGDQSVMGNILLQIGKTEASDACFIYKSGIKSVYESQIAAIPGLQETEDKQLELIKKELYSLRGIQKEQDLREQQRLSDLKNRKPLSVPKKPFTYDFSGEFISKKKVNWPLLRAQSIEFRPLEVKNRQKRAKALNEETELDGARNSFRNTSNRLFANAFKRQISHLPFLKLTQNSKLIENNRVLAGPILKTQVSQESSFRHFSERDKQAGLEQGESQYSEQEVSIACSQRLYHPHRQSKMMQKYLRKLSHQVEQIPVIGNFRKVSVTQDSPTQRYYRYNYDGK